MNFLGFVGVAPVALVPLGTTDPVSKFVIIYKSSQKQVSSVWIKSTKNAKIVLKKYCNTEPNNTSVFLQVKSRLGKIYFDQLSFDQLSERLAT